eukprot:1269436-Rhodomonas_salina.2
MSDAHQHLTDVIPALAHKHLSALEWPDCAKQVIPRVSRPTHDFACVQQKTQNQSLLQLIVLGIAITIPDDRNPSQVRPVDVQ